MYLVGYAVPAFPEEVFTSYSGYRAPLLEQEVFDACIVALIGTSTMAIGMLIPIQRALPVSFLHWPDDGKLVASRFGIAAIVGGIGEALNHLSLVPEVLAQPVLLLRSMSTIGVVVVFALWKRGRASPAWCLVSLVSLAPILVTAFGNSHFAEFMKPIGTLGVAYYALTRRIPWYAVAIALAIFIPGNVVKGEFRTYTAENSVGFWERPGLMGHMILDHYTRPDRNAPTFDEAGGAASNRVSQIAGLARVVSWTPDRIPYWDGETYETLLYKPIPRFVVPDKLRANLGQDYGHRYDFIDYSDYATSVNLPQLVETYANFGMIGVVVGMLLIGMFYGGVTAFFDRPQTPLVAVAAGATVVSSMLNVESDFATVNGGFIVQLPVLWLMMHGMTWRVQPTGGLTGSMEVMGPSEAASAGSP
jgi:hypothetical protein